MILYICGNKKNAHDMDFLNDFDKVDCKIASEFSVRRFLDEANTYVNQMCIRDKALAADH